MTYHTPDEIAAYLGEPVDFTHDIGLIHTCVRIVGRFAPGDPQRDAVLVNDAADSIFDFVGDYLAEPVTAYFGHTLAEYRPSLWSRTKRRFVRIIQSLDGLLFSLRSLGPQR